MLMTHDERRASPTSVAAIEQQEAAERERERGEVRDHIKSPTSRISTVPWLDLTVDTH